MVGVRLWLMRRRGLLGLGLELAMELVAMDLVDLQLGLLLRLKIDLGVRVLSASLSDRIG